MQEKGTTGGWREGGERIQNGDLSTEPKPVHEIRQTPLGETRSRSGRGEATASLQEENRSSTLSKEEGEGFIENAHGT